MSKLDDIFLPHPFKGMMKPLQITTTGDSEKIYANSYSGCKQQIKDLMAEIYQEALDLHNHTGLSLTSAFKQIVAEL